ncbi:hypothetical protein N8J89_30940 [Crossiella sp. CA-258035]|uniref:hypothetical protein n=1 Tax=Crossiella sp. CA-258035 TaxID=2981138 RepID=UPI0024BC2F78|nr:hypothetical protein [Crossiella sp. CA-258035]WHT17517.1 hypothetical protein N8J89_30940 [Crossiella sp. CA-258035]
MAPTRRAAAPHRRRPAVAGSRTTHPARPGRDSDTGALEETGTRAAAAADEATAVDEAGAEPVVAERVRSRPPRAGRWLVALTVALALLAGFFLVQGWRTSGSPAARNQALVNGPATAEVSGQVAEALRRVFSYRHDDTASTEAAAAEVLVDAARAQYDALFAQVREQAPQQKLVLSTKAVTTGVRELSADRAVLLVFLDQTATRGDNNQTSASAAQLGVTARRAGEKWLITELQPR